MLVRALVGLWSVPELSIRPGRQAVTLVLLLAALAATPVTDGRMGFTSFQWNPPTVVPLAEKVRMELTGQLHQPVWRYHDEYYFGL
jgi:hypothetical protein